MDRFVDYVFRILSNPPSKRRSDQNPNKFLFKYFALIQLMMDGDPIAELLKALVLLRTAYYWEIAYLTYWTPHRREMSYNPEWIDEVIRAIVDDESVPNDARRCRRNGDSPTTMPGIAVRLVFTNFYGRRRRQAQGSSTGTLLSLRAASGLLASHVRASRQNYAAFINSAHHF